MKTDTTTNPIYRGAYDAVHDALTGARRLHAEVGTTLEVERHAAPLKLIGASAPNAVRRARKAKPAKVAPVAAKARKKAGTKRTPAQLAELAARFTAHVVANPGQTIEAIGKALGVKTAELAGPVGQLRKSGAVKTHGMKRATTYTVGAKTKTSKKGANGVAAHAPAEQTSAAAE